MKSISLDIWSILILISMAQGIFMIIFLIIKKGGSKATHFLLALLGVFVWLQAEFLSIRIPYDLGVNLFYGTRYGSWLVIGPLFYFYTRSLIDSNYQFKLKNSIHFLPFIVFAILIPLFSTDFLSFRQMHYGMLSVFDKYNEHLSFIQGIYSVIFIIQFFHLLTYLIISESIIRKHAISLKEIFSNIDKINLKWLKNLSFLMIIVLSFSVIFLFVLFFSAYYRRQWDYLYVFPMSFFTYLTSFRYTLHPELFDSQISRFNGNKKYSKSSLTREQASQYLKDLKTYLSEEKPFLNNELRLQELAEALSMSPHHLSQVINDQLNLNFYDFINQYRIEEAKRIIKSKGNEKTLLQIAYMAGFNNKTSFTNAFKKNTGMTPSSYKESTLT
ncbi:helix-turn-helix domain-containing protein [Fulvivirgaceae bacterium BMA10]|uniref:Helix-turn-helix domain-containing protein n=1 Tax=Splendidivirga corallicola TaxID=3051826 RepID=A0ABT8KQG4_9BACT|nr:helix-turn-helix domain-containing protein [Fulvivirgaceae bacterium BMA10]